MFKLKMLGYIKKIPAIGVSIIVHSVRKVAYWSFKCVLILAHAKQV